MYVAVKGGEAAIDNVKGTAAGGCWGFISGVEQTLMYDQKERGAARVYCAPEAGKIDDLARAWVAHLGLHGENLKKPAIQSYIEAMVETFPCSGTK